MEDRTNAQQQPPQPQPQLKEDRGRGGSTDSLCSLGRPRPVTSQGGKPRVWFGGKGGKGLVGWNTTKGVFLRAREKKARTERNHENTEKRKRDFRTTQFKRLRTWGNSMEGEMFVFKMLFYKIGGKRSVLVLTCLR